MAIHLEQSVIMSLNDFVPLVSEVNECMVDYRFLFIKDRNLYQVSRISLFFSDLVLFLSYALNRQNEQRV